MNWYFDDNKIDEKETLHADPFSAVCEYALYLAVLLHPFILLWRPECL